MKFVQSILIFLTLTSLIGCQTQPSEAEALEAINRVPDQVIKAGLIALDKEDLYDQFAVKFLRENIEFERVDIYSCYSADPKLGYVCDVLIYTPRVPILGGADFKVTLRFNEELDGWYAYIN